LNNKKILEKIMSQVFNYNDSSNLLTRVQTIQVALAKQAPSEQIRTAALQQTQLEYERDLRSRLETVVLKAYKAPSANPQIDNAALQRFSMNLGLTCESLDTIQTNVKIANLVVGITNDLQSSPLASLHERINNLRSEYPISMNLGNRQALDELSQNIHITLFKNKFEEFALSNNDFDETFFDTMLPLYIEIKAHFKKTQKSLTAEQKLVLEKLEKKAHAYLNTFISFQVGNEENQPPALGPNPVLHANLSALRAALEAEKNNIETGNGNVKELLQATRDAFNKLPNDEKIKLFEAQNAVLRGANEPTIPDVFIQPKVLEVVGIPQWHGLAHFDERIAAVEKLIGIAAPVEKKSEEMKRRLQEAESA
jgi:hypothetical protein